MCNQFYQVHELKIQKEYLKNIIEGKKRFEIRRNDRDYQVGDHIKYAPVRHESGLVSSCTHEFGKIPDFKITYIHSDLGLKEGYVAMTIEEFDK